MTLTAWSVNVPLNMAPMALSKNGRVHWSARNRAFQAQKNFVIRIWQCEQSPELREHLVPWQRAWLFVDWRYRLGKQPDDDNIVSRVSAARDAMQHIGLVLDDAVIETGPVQFHKVAAGEECAVVTIIGNEDMARECALRIREGRS